MRYPRAVSSGVVETDEIIEEIEMISTVSGGDILGTLYGIADVTARKLAEGKIVRIQGLGSFRVTFDAKSYNSSETAKPDVTKVIDFRPDKRIKQMLNNVDFSEQKAKV